jgi:putative glycosyltransferase
MELSIVTTMYASAPWLREFHERASAAARALTEDYEIVLVNDGSPDESLAVALELFEADPRVRVIDFSRNFGHHKAMMTGLAAARGRRVFLIDCDLEEEPEWLVRFDREAQARGADVV